MRLHVRELGESSSNQVKELDKLMTELMKEYGMQVQSNVNERMREWNNQTKNFCQSMINAVQTINEIVDSMEMKRR